VLVSNQTLTHLVQVEAVVVEQVQHLPLVLQLERLELQTQVVVQVEAVRNLTHLPILEMQMVVQA
jgi:hypothetical protein